MKYKLTDETKEISSQITSCHILHRIECVEAFGKVKVGDKGGWIEKEENLSQEGTCWVYDEAIVCHNAKVCDDASVCEYAKISCNSIISGNAVVGGHATIIQNAHIYDNAVVRGNAKIFGSARLYGDCLVGDNVEIFGTAKIYNSAIIFDDAVIAGNSDISGGRVRGKACILSNAEIFSNRDYMVFENNWSSGRYFTWTRSNNMWAVGCFHGTGEELIKKAYEDSENSGKHYEAYVKLVEQLQEIENIKPNE